MRVVLDTGVLISALLFKKGRLTWLRAVWSTGALTPIVSRETVDELVRVLAYPKFRLSDDDIQTVLAAYLPFCDVASRTVEGTAGLPRCDDPGDQTFLELTSCAKADLLVTGDAELLELAGRVSFEIVSPSKLRVRLARSASD